MKDKTKDMILPAAGVMWILCCLLSLGVGAVPLSPREILDALISGPTGPSGWIFWYSRLPRTLGCMLAGGALALSGAVIQTVLHNKLASPGIIGVNAGAGFSVTACCALGFLGGWSVTAAAFLGAVAAVTAVVFVSRKLGASRSTVILGGVAVSSFLTALSEALVTLVPDAGVLAGDFRVGGFSAVAPGRLFPAGVLILLAAAAVLIRSNELSVLSLGDDTARSLGMPVHRVRRFFLMAAATLAGAAVSFAGLLGFVGLIVPHMVRSLPGGREKLLPLCALLGSCFVTVCDSVARSLFAPYELPVGILMSVIGGPFFIALLIRRKGGKAHD